MELLNLQVADACQYFALYGALNRRRHLISDTKVDSQYVNKPFSEAQKLFLFGLL